MTEHQKDTAFLTRAIRFDDTEERRALEEKITQVQRDTRCVKRAIVLMAIAGALAVAGFAYGTFLLENFPYGKHQTIVRIIYLIGLTSLLSLGTFSFLLLFYRLKLDGLREDCRRLVTKLLECPPQRAGGREMTQDPPQGSSEGDASLQWARTPGIPSTN